MLLGVNRLLGRPPNYRHCALGALLGAGYASACLLPGWRFLGGIPWRVGCLALACMGGNKLGQRLLEVELVRNGRKVHLLALADTGNGLRDPITGEQVLIIGPEAAQALTGLTKKQLADPVGTLAERPIPCLRLIPYRVVGHGGMLLALNVEQARIGQYRGSVLVAFAPEELEASGRYQALAGGMSG